MFIFRTKNLDHDFYENMVRRILYEFLTSKEMLQFLRTWHIEFHSLEFANIQFYEHVKLQEGLRINPKMPSGVTGQNQVLLYLHDSKNFMKMRENSDRIQHELCHAVLYFLHNDKKAKGKKNVLAVSAVHDNPSIYQINYWFKKWLIWRKMQIALIDIRYLTKARNRQP